MIKKLTGFPMIGDPAPPSRDLRRHRCVLSHKELVAILRDRALRKWMYDDTDKSETFLHSRACAEYIITLRNVVGGRPSE